MPERKKPFTCKPAMGEAFAPFVDGYQFTRKSTPVREIQKEIDRAITVKFASTRVGRSIYRGLGINPEGLQSNPLRGK